MEVPGEVRDFLIPALTSSSVRRCKSAATGGNDVGFNAGSKAADMEAATIACSAYIAEIVLSPG
jgi:hypothetical protein